VGGSQKKSPGQQRRQLGCPRCGELGPLVSNARRRGNFETVRDGHCDSCGHTFKVIERVVIEELRYQRSDGMFSALTPTSLETHLTKWVRKTLTPATCRMLAAETYRRLQEQRTTAPGHTEGWGYMPASQHPAKAKVPFITHSVVRGTFVDVFRSMGQLVTRDSATTRDQLLAARAQYELQMLGRGEGPLQEAKDVVSWLADEFSIDAPGLPARRSPWQTQVLLTDQPPSVQRVVKNHSALLAAAPTSDPVMSLSYGRAAREVNDFKENKFSTSVEFALEGRPEAVHKARVVHHLVFSSLRGQRLINSWQLSSAAADCLRGLDDIAYLRWVAIAKALTVDQLLDEAVGLVEHPSPQIVASPSSATFVARIDPHHSGSLGTAEPLR
jgi:transcriptional regulator NrdR family protein